MDDLQSMVVKDLRGQLEDSDTPKFVRDWCTDDCLQRFLMARNWSISAAKSMIDEAIRWRSLRRPESIVAAEMEVESRTGKIYVPGRDRWGRPVIIFDNTVQNTSNIDNQMRFLAWSLEFAIRDMPTHTDKYVIFMHLNRFSMFNSPPLKSTMETIQMLCYSYPERLGHCILYQPPDYFSFFFSTIKHLLDKRTASKVVLISGDSSVGSDSSNLLNEIIGANWRTLTGAEQARITPESSPGYDHEVYWSRVMDRERFCNVSRALTAPLDDKPTDNNIVVPKKKKKSNFVSKIPVNVMLSVVTVLMAIAALIVSLSSSYSFLEAIVIFMLFYAAFEFLCYQTSVYSLRKLRPIDHGPLMITSSKCVVTSDFLFGIVSTMNK